MGMAAMSLGLSYVGVEANEDVVSAAELRLGAFAMFKVYTLV